MLREKWQEKVLGNLITLEYGAGLPESSRSGSGFPVYGSSGIVGHHEDYLVNGPGIVVGRKGTVGAVAWSKRPFWPIDTAYYVNTKGEVETRWCYWLLQSIGLDHLDNSTGVPGLNRNDAYSIRVKIPPLPEQRRIAEILDTIDEAIQKTEALISKLKAIKQGLLHDLLTRGLDKNGKLRDTKDHPEQFKDSPLGRIPRKWKVNRLGQMCELLNGLAFKPSDWSSTGIPIIRIQNLNQGTEFNYFNGIVPDKYIIPPGTLLFSWSGNRGTSFGPFIWSGPTGVLNQHIFKVIPREGIYLHWFCYSLDDVRQRVERAAHGGSGLVHIKRSDLTSYLVATPDEKEQKQIEERISSHDARIRTEEQYRDKLKLQKKGLMHDLLTGKVRVKV